MMQMISKAMPPKTAATATNSGSDVKASGGSKNDNLSAFGSVFGQIMSASNQTTQPAQQTAAGEINQLAAVLNAESIEEVLDLLDIPHDDGLLMLQIGEDGKAVAMDEMLNLENLMGALGIDSEQLQKLVQKLLGEDKEAKDVWELLALVDVQAPVLQAQVVTALQGEGQVTPKEATQLLQVLKLAQLVGQKKQI